MVAEQENLGDLKLYRIPEPVTVAPIPTRFDFYDLDYEAWLG